LLKVAMPRFGEDIAPCFEYSATVAIFTIAGQRVEEQMDFALQSREALDRVRLLRDQQVDVLICGGVQEAVERLLEARGIRVISWVGGRVEDLLQQFIAGRLVPGSARLGGDGRPDKGIEDESAE
jgi:predicted Fe-Mo cluster-binding NifX family protein